MKRIILFILITNIPYFVWGQKSLFDTLRVDPTTKIMARYPHHDESKKYEKYNFIIEDSTKIVEFIKNLKLGYEVPNAMEKPNFRIAVVKNKDEIGYWTINPTQKSAMTHDGKTYKFDLAQIADLNQTFPFKYVFEKKQFTSKAEYEIYLTEQKKNPNFLFVYAPLFKYEGSFEIEFQKSSTYPTPKAISEFLSPMIEKIVEEHEYSLSYGLSKKNRENQDQFTMNIKGSKKLFQELKVDGLLNENWELTSEFGTFFYKQ
jgi:hypothetical protein